MNDVDALLILNAIRGLGNRRIKDLLDHFGSAKKVLETTANRLKTARIIPTSVVDNIARFAKEDFLQDETELIRKNRVEILTIGDADYPKNLKEIPDAPVVLYCRGRMPKRNDLAVAVVGSRRASFYGLSVAEKLAGALCECGITVVSGLARGIDAAAHRGALRVRGETIAVMGSGLTQIYPPEHKKLFAQICESGAVVSEFPMTTQPLAGHFPRRNRIISGLSLGVVIVEASRKSGALITADFALEQGREVFAVPGKVDSPTSQGVFTLIKQGAKLISHVEDIIEELKPQIQSVLYNEKRQPSQSPPAISLKSLTEKEIRIYNSLTAAPVHIDELSRTLQLPVADTNALLLQLELKKIVRQLPGKLFARTH